jgi:hypothetical protein
MIGLQRKKAKNLVLIAVCTTTWQALLLQNQREYTEYRSAMP